MVRRIVTLFFDAGTFQLMSHRNGNNEVIRVLLSAGARRCMAEPTSSVLILGDNFELFLAMNSG